MLAVATADGDVDDEAAGGSRRTWQLLGLIALADPPRASARGVVSAFATAGVRTVMVTGDHPATAGSIARALGIEDSAACVRARVRPDGKTAIVRELQAAGDVVAMTGDGVNDAPAVRAADVGVAVGAEATEVARQAADLIVTGDDLSPLVTAIAEGRRAYDNLRRFLHYALSGGLAEVFVMLVGPLFGFGVALQPGQILWVNLLTHGLPGVAMGNEPAEADVLTRPPRNPREPLLDRRTVHRVVVLGAAVAAACIGVGLWARRTGHPWQSSIFATLAATQLAAALALRPRRSHGNPLLTVAVIGNAVLAVLAVRWAPLAELLHAERLGWHELGVCAVAALVIAAAARVQSRPQRAG